MSLPNTTSQFSAYLAFVLFRSTKEAIKAWKIHVYRLRLEKGMQGTVATRAIGDWKSRVLELATPKDLLVCPPPLERLEEIIARRGGGNREDGDGTSGGLFFPERKRDAAMTSTFPSTMDVIRCQVCLWVRMLFLWVTFVSSAGREESTRLAYLPNRVFESRLSAFQPPQQTRPVE